MRASFTLIALVGREFATSFFPYFLTPSHPICAACGLYYRQLASADLPFTFPVDVAVEEPSRKNCKYFPGNGVWMKTGEGGGTNLGENSRDEERWPLAADPEWFKMALKGHSDCRKNADGLDAAPLPPRAQPVGTETRVSAVTWGYSSNTAGDLRVSDSPPIKLQLHTLTMQGSNP